MRWFQALFRPLTAAVMASLLTALLLPPNTQIVERVMVRDPIQPTVIREVTVVNRHIGCDRQTVLNAVNEVLRSSASTGDAGVANAADADVSQAGTARSGDAILGQVIDVSAVCSTVEVNATNQVSDSKAETGDAEVDNEVELQSSPDPSTPNPDATPAPLPTQPPWRRTRR